MDLKTILNNVLTQSSFLEKGGFTTSSDPDDKQMVAMANRAAYEIMNYWNWPELRSTGHIDLNSGQFRYVLPPDFQDLVPDSAWQGDGERRVEWPVPNGRWFMYKFSSWSDGGTMRIRRYGNEIEVHDPASGESFDYEYISKWPIVSAEGERKELFTEDTDEFLLDDQVLILGIQAHWQQAKLMPSYAEHFGNYNRKMAEAIGRANGGTTIGGPRHPNRFSPYYPLWRPSN
jgi:hypothetical protein